MATYTKRQFFTLFAISLAQFCSALCISIQAPFFPAEAEKKGATPSQYGFVFGIYELVIFLFCPIYGKFLDTIGVKLVNNTGIFVVSATCLLFGFLAYMNDATTFIAFSFIIRVVEATGTSAFITSAFSIIAQEFPDDVASTFAALETCFGIGLILGPTIGGVLYEAGGFLLPFAVVGGLLAFSGILIFFLLPSQDAPIETQATQSILSLLSEAPFVIGTAIVIATSYSIGFVQATLEPHIRNLQLTPLEIGLLFIVNGTAYAVSAPVWGRMCDRLLAPHYVTCIGSMLIVVAFMLIGPAPFLPIRTSLVIVIISLILHGLGMGAALIASFSGFHRDAITIGLPDNISTYGVVSGLWTSAFALGAFVGPSAAGVLFDQVGFPWASQTVVGFHALLFLASVIFSCCFKKRRLPVKYLSEDSLLIDPSLETSYGAI